MQNSWNNGQDPPAQFPRSELNPLTNATLGKNLGRWAQVYFTTPPERREHAVSKLLRELENETAVTPSTHVTMEGIAVPSAGTAERHADVLCPACQHRNRGGQRFCGSCGSPLQATEAARAPKRDEAFAANPAPESVATAHPESDVQWLRDKALASLEESDTPANHGWRYLVAGVAVLLAGFGYLQWASQPHRPRAGATVAPAATEPATNAPQPQLQADQPAPGRAHEKPVEVAPQAHKSPTVQTTLATRENVNKKPVETSLGPAAPRFSPESASLPSSQANVEAGAGSQELLLAERYLEGKTGARDTTEAGKWLWKAVAKKNSTAAVLLADLYARGEGVPKNCDQARILLVAAAKKGAPQAAPALRNLETSGCQ